MIPAAALAWLLAEPADGPQAEAPDELPAWIVVLPLGAAPVLLQVEVGALPLAVEQAGLLVWASVLFQAGVPDRPPGEAAVLLRVEAAAGPLSWE